MKAIIISAGEGKRLRPITTSRPKPLIPIAGKPLLEHTILGLKNSGIKDILLIVGYKEKLIKGYFGDGKERFGLNIEYITQKEQLGTAHAFSYGKGFAANEPVLLMYGDLLVEPIIYQEIIQKFHENRVEGIILLKEVKNPEEFGIISLNSNNYVDKIIEKPTPDMNAGNLANAGVFIFNSKIFQAIEKTEKSIRGEYEFTDSMKILINLFNGKIAGYIIKDYFWSDIGLPWQLLDGNNYLLSKIEKKVLSKIEENIQISGKVYIGAGTNIQAGSHIQGPCFIGNNNTIGPNTVIRPNTFIADNCIISMSEIKNSIILSKTVIPYFNYVGDSIICENVKLGAGTKVTNFRSSGESIKVYIKGQLVDSRKIKLGTIIGPNVKIGINVSIMAGKIIYENSIIGANTIVNDDIPPNTSYSPNPNEGIIEKEP